MEKAPENRRGEGEQTDVDRYSAQVSQGRAQLSEVTGRRALRVEQLWTKGSRSEWDHQVHIYPHCLFAEDLEVAGGRRAEVTFLEPYST